MDQNPSHIDLRAEVRQAFRRFRYHFYAALTAQTLILLAAGYYFAVTRDAAPIGQLAVVFGILSFVVNYLER
jgi:hypothetical protein